MISQKLFDRRTREIQKQDYCLSMSDIDFFINNHLYQMWQSTKAEMYRHTSTLTHIQFKKFRFDKFVNNVKNRGRKVIYDYRKKK